MPKKRLKYKQVDLTERKPKKITFKRILPYLVFLFVFLLFLLSANFLISNLTNLNIFKLQQVFVEGKNIKLSGKEAFDYCLVPRGDSLLTTDLEALRDRILRTHPELKEVTLIKDYPDAIRIFIKERNPIAQIEGEEYFLVDEEAFILGKSLESPLPELPVIIGISSRHIKTGAFSQSSKLKRAIQVVKLLALTGFSTRYKIKSIDVTNIDNISFFMEDNVEIKLGKDDFRKKIEKIESRLPNLDLTQIRYIDLRFRDLIVAPR
jgi:cell division septal protein FtsQ